MIRFARTLVALLFAAQFFTASAGAQSERWMTLPPTPSLPVPTQPARAEVNGASIWYAMFPKAAIVGWSDGAIIGPSLAMNHPDRVSRLFAFAANSDPSGVKEVDKSPVFQQFIARAEKEYEALSAIERGNTELMAGAIARAGLLLQPEVSHFSMLQDPAQFTSDVLRFLERSW